MGQLIPVYHAESEYLALSIQDELAGQGIGCVVLDNEIPLHPGFNFGARPWAEIRVRAEDLAAAGEIIADLEAMLVAEDTADPYTPAINIQTATWFSLLCVGMMVFVFLVGIIRDWYLYEESYAWVNPFILVIATYVAIGIGFAILNGRRISGTVTTALLGLLVLPVIIVWLAASLIILVLRALIGDMIALGRPDPPGISDSADLP